MNIFSGNIHCSLFNVHLSLQRRSEMNFIYLLISFLLTASLVSATTLDNSRLVNAVKNRDIAMVRGLLKQHVDPNAPDVDGTTPLIWGAHGARRRGYDSAPVCRSRGQYRNRPGVACSRSRCECGGAPTQFHPDADCRL